MPGDRGVGRVDHVRVAARERPRDPRVDGAEAQVALAAFVELIQQPSDLGGRHVRRDADALALQYQAVDDGAQVLPAEAGADGFAAGAVPHDRRRPLIGDADAVDLAHLGERSQRGVARRVGHRVRVELDLAGLGRLAAACRRGAAPARLRRRRRPTSAPRLVPTSTTRTFVTGGSPCRRAAPPRQPSAVPICSITSAISAAERLKSPTSACTSSAAIKTAASPAAAARRAVRDGRRRAVTRSGVAAERRAEHQAADEDEPRQRVVASTRQHLREHVRGADEHQHAERAAPHRDVVQPLRYCQGTRPHGVSGKNLPGLRMPLGSSDRLIDAQHVVRRLTHARRRGSVRG